MGLNISQAMNNSHFENKENLRNTAKNILSKQGASAEKAQQIIEQSIFPQQKYPNLGMSILSTSTQITLNNSLKETLKYLKNNSKKEVKKHKLGELKNLKTLNNSNYEGELANYEINYNEGNFFIAA